jgi:hypothetical protein
MNSKQRKTHIAIFSTPTPKSLTWADIDSLLTALGCERFKGDGSHVAFRRDGKKVDFHRPHPGKEAKAYQVRDAKNFLSMLGEKP